MKGPSNNVMVILAALLACGMGAGGIAVGARNGTAPPAVAPAPSREEFNMLVQRMGTLEQKIDQLLQRGPCR